MLDALSQLRAIGARPAPVKVEKTAKPRRFRGLAGQVMALFERHERQTSVSVAKHLGASVEAVGAVFYTLEKLRFVKSVRNETQTYFITNNQ